ncbi:sigma-70 family RNA polymerase sigma factor [Pseudenhygromyxa sp. WMMC2535]|uniref:sigma-70 family RNA polymerase sigma factor n=1 Tax=Pseudenhygromyxa sp. WMMC2535 TaxID=2712867 RepID=UPI00155205B6|nr:sigma-70 family RNA polymerase sigma factor [Pseudenhygromyxa sp. WMMC2535]NVB42090.1 sigma-70 family RNA polymerase sigma factor [Pseudenhygromyxa sp. WMMC2535]
MARRKVTRGAPPQLARSSRSKSWPSSSRRAGRSAKGETDSANFLSVYFREMSDLDVMSAEQELEAAVRIFELRKVYWRTLLSYPPFIDGVVAFIESKVDADEVPAKELRALRKASRELRDRETRVNKDNYDELVNALSERMLDLDVDNLIAEAITEEVRSLEIGQRHGLELAVKPPREGSKPFATYAKDVRGASRALRHAKNAFVKANLRLVVSIARRFNHGRMPLQDLIQEGNIGLMKAVDRFDYRKGFRFSTYGSWWIRHAISRAIADKGRQVRLPVHMIDAYHKVNKARRELEAKLSREPTREELAKHTGLALSKIEKMGTLLVDSPVSLDKPVSDDDGRKVVDFLEDDNAETPGEGLEAEALNEEVKRLVAKLRPIEADILRKRFGLIDEEELTLKEIGGQYSLSRERIRQLQEQALGKIRRELKRLELM